MEEWLNDSDIYKKANSTKLIDLFKYYNLHLNNHIKKCACPFKHHKSGKESTASFYFYPETNSFWCFGCKTGTMPVDFVSAFESINRYQAAQKILSLDLQRDFFIETEESDNDVLFEFFSLIRDIRKQSDNAEFQLFIEEAMGNFDSLYDKYSLNKNEKALISLINKTKEKIKNFIIENNLCQVQLF